MEMHGQRELSATQEQAWEALNDPAMLKSCIPGCETFEADGENAYRVTVALRIGPVAAKFNGRVQLSDIQAPTSYRLEFDAQGGVAGFGKGQSSVTLTPKESGCELAYTVQSTVGGKIAQLGQRLIDGVAKSLAEDFFKRFDAELQKRHLAAGADSEGAAEGGSTGGEATGAAASDGHSSPASAQVPRSAEQRSSDQELPLWVWAVLLAAAVGVFWWGLG